MLVRKEIREERTDLYTFYAVETKTDKNGIQYEIETDLETVSIFDIQKNKAEKMEELAVIENKLNLINTL